MGKNRWKKCLKKVGLLGNTVQVRGEITVFVSLLLAVLLIFLLSVSEAVYLTMGKGRLARTVVAGNESVLGEYDPFLWEQFHIFVLDETYGSEKNVLENRIQQYVEQTFPDRQNVKTGSLYDYKVEDVAVINKAYLVDDIEYLKNQIREYMKYEMSHDAVEQVFQQMKVGISKEEIEQAKKDLKQTQAEVENPQEIAGKLSDDKKTKTDFLSKNTDNGVVKEKNTTREPDEKQVTKDPRKALKKALKTGVVELITGRSDISKEYYDEKMNSIEVGSETSVSNDTIQFEKAEDITRQLQGDMEVKSMTQDAITEMLALEYSVAHFSNLLDDSASKIECQLEYLVAGKNSDYENVRSVCNQLLAVRFSSNYMCILKMPEKMVQADALATSIVGATLNPAVVKLVSYLLLACESYIQSIIDVRTVMNGGMIPAVHSASSWSVDLAHADEILNDTPTAPTKQVQSEKKHFGELDYKDCLKLLLFMQIQKKIKYERMLYMIDLLGRKNREDFKLEHMIMGYESRVRVQLTPLFGGSFVPTDAYVFEFHKYCSY